MGRRRRSDPAHPPRPVRRPRRWWCPATARLIGVLRRRHLGRPAHRHAARHPGPGRGLPGDAHRDVGAPGGAGQPAPCCGERGVHVVEPGRGPPRRWRRGRRSAGVARRHRRRGHRGARPLAGQPDARPPAARPRRARHGRRHPRAHRPGPLHRQPLVGQAGPRPRRGGRWPAGPPSPSSPRPTVPSPPASSVVRGRHRGRDARRGRSPGPTQLDVVVMAAAVADFRPVEVAGNKIKKADGVPDVAPRAHPRHPGRARRVRSVPVRPWSGSPPRPPTWPPTPPTSSPARAPTSSSPTTCRRPAHRLRARHERRAHPLGVRVDAPMSPCPTSGRWPERCSTPWSPSDPARTPHRAPSDNPSTRSST